MLDRIHLEWVSGMTTLGQVVESEGVCNCETNYYDDETETEKQREAKRLNKLKSLSDEERKNIQLINDFLSPSFHDGAINRDAVFNISSEQNNTATVGGGSGSNNSNSSGQPVRAGRTGRRLTLMLNKRLIVRKNVVASLMDHEICTHALRFANEWEQVCRTPPPHVVCFSFFLYMYAAIVSNYIFIKYVNTILHIYIYIYMKTCRSLGQVEGRITGYHPPPHEKSPVAKKDSPRSMVC
jgi:hypothetical protein